ncbi:hypothetical protein HF526_27945 [Pseudonocardia sp. K10HN5]|uniref:Mutator family transposase n=1 Tax=Pseudonocardia acidicola TaxID=2724939 RepID=A0ABX1SLF5_9PSEU|nr:hypothetical protein [Pseudonocardia acidicola]
MDELTTWQNRPLDRVYPVLFIDAIHVKIRDGQVANRPIYVVLGINCEGERDVLGLWVGTGGEGAKHWMAGLTELGNRGVADVCIVACDGLKGLPEAIAEVWPLATVQGCVVHLVRATLALRVEGALERNHQGAAHRLHGPDRRRGRGAVRRVRTRMGRALPGDQPALALVVGAVHPVPGVPAGEPRCVGGPSAEVRESAGSVPAATAQSCPERSTVIVALLDSDPMPQPRSGRQVPYNRGSRCVVPSGRVTTGRSAPSRGRSTAVPPPS